jgi:hypothetical protein
MIFGLVAITKSKLHPLSSIIKSVAHWALTCLIFVGKVVKTRGNNLGKLGGSMWLWGANQLVLWVSYNEKLAQQHFILLVTTLETWHNQYSHENLVFISKWLVWNMLVTLATYDIEQWKRPPPLPLPQQAYNIWFHSLDQHHSQLWFCRFCILWSWFTIVNLLKFLILNSYVGSFQNVGGVHISLIYLTSKKKYLNSNTYMHQKCWFLMSSHSPLHGWTLIPMKLMRPWRSNLDIGP